MGLAKKLYEPKKEEHFMKFVKRSNFQNSSKMIPKLNDIILKTLIERRAEYTKSQRGLSLIKFFCFLLERHLLGIASD